MGLGKKYETQVGIDLEWGEKTQAEGSGEVRDGNEEDGEVSPGNGEVVTESKSGEEIEFSGDQIERDIVQGRERRAHIYLNDFVSGDSLFDDDEVNMVQDAGVEDPIHFEDAVKEQKWRQAMDNEINYIEKNNTWTLSELPKSVKKIGVKWVFKTKRDENGKIIKHKARLVAKGYSQKQGIDYSEVFASVARLDTMRMVIATTTQKG